jgi:spore coat protein U-like protein
MHRSSWKTLAVAAAVGAVSFVEGPSAEAATEVANLSVSADVQTSCLIATLPVNFGVYDPFGAQAATPLDNSAGAVVVTCVNGLPITIRLGAGLAGGGSGAGITRNLQGPNPGDLLGYQLYSDSPGGTVWGDTPASGVATAGTGAAQSLAIHGRVPEAQNPAAGLYTDTVVASVDF